MEAGGLPGDAGKPVGKPPPGGLGEKDGGPPAPLKGLMGSGGMPGMPGGGVCAAGLEPEKVSTKGDTGMPPGDGNPGPPPMGAFISGGKPGLF